MREQELARDLNPEIEILLCCARKSLGSPQSARLTKILEGQVDWPLLFRLANDNGLLPLVCAHLLPNFSVIPPETVTQYREANRRNALRTLFLTAELLRITEFLRKRQIPALSYKGPVLAQLAYGNPQLRQFDDLDIVVPQGAMPQVYEAMETLGYEARFARARFLRRRNDDIPGEYVFLHKINRAIVEFHTESTLRHFPRPPDVDEMFGRSTDVSLNGRAVSTFAQADMLLMLCVHGAKDFWSRLVWVADIAALVEGLAASEWQQLFAKAKKCDAQRMVRLGLLLASAIFESELSPFISEEIKRDRVAMRVGQGLCHQLLHQKKTPGGIRSRSLYRIHMVPSLWPGICYWLRLSTVPAEEDWAMTPGRNRFRATYAFLRPLRLWRKYGHSAETEEVAGRKN
jgi:hypothetical protein